MLLNVNLDFFVTYGNHRNPRRFQRRFHSRFIIFDERNSLEFIIFDERNSLEFIIKDFVHRR